MHVHTETTLSTAEVRDRFSAIEGDPTLTYAHTRTPPKLYLSRLPAPAHG